MAGSIEVLTFPATLDGFNAEFETLRSWLDQERVPPKPHYDAELVYEEVVTNIIRYGYDDPTGQSVEVKLERLPDGLMMTFTDSGMAFDPLQSVDPAVPKSIDEAKIGGLGIKLVRQAAADMRYERTAQGQNRLCVKIGAEAK